MDVCDVTHQLWSELQLPQAKISLYGKYRNVRRAQDNGDRGENSKPEVDPDCLLFPSLMNKKKTEWIMMFGETRRNQEVTGVSEFFSFSFWTGPIQTCKTFHCHVCNCCKFDLAIARFHYTKFQNETQHTEENLRTQRDIVIIVYQKMVNLSRPYIFWLIQILLSLGIKTFSTKISRSFLNWKFFLEKENKWILKVE